MILYSDLPVERAVYIRLEAAFVMVEGLERTRFVVVVGRVQVQLIEEVLAERTRLLVAPPLLLLVENIKKTN